MVRVEVSTDNYADAKEQLTITVTLDDGYSFYTSLKDPDAKSLKVMFDIISDQIGWHLDPNYRRFGYLLERFEELEKATKGE